MSEDQWLPLAECDLYSGYSGGTVTELHRVPFIKLPLIMNERLSVVMYCTGSKKNVNNREEQCR